MLVLLGRFCVIGVVLTACQFISVRSLADDGSVKIALPDVVDTLDIGGDGNYLALHFKALRKIGVFDVRQRKLIGYVPVGDDNIEFAAGHDKLIVLSGDSGVISRYDLVTQERELTKTIDTGGNVSNFLLGSASNGPAILGVGARHSSGALSVDLTTLDSSPIEIRGTRGIAGSNVRTSADGSVFGVWQSSVSPSGLQTYVRTGNQWNSHYEHSSVGYVLPSADGKTIYTAAGRFTNHLRPLGKVSQVSWTARGGSLPAVNGPFYLSLSAGNAATGGPNPTQQVRLHIEGDERPIGTIEDLHPVWAPGERMDRAGGLTIERRLMLVPSANVVLQLSSSHDEIIATPIDIAEMLKRSEVPFLLVVSQPPITATVGEPLNYPVEVMSKSGVASLQLDSGPEGMTMDSEGVLMWTPTTSSPAETNVVVSVADHDGQQIFHTFHLDVAGGDEMNSYNPIATTLKHSKPNIVETSPAEFPESIRNVAMPGTISDITYGSSGRLILASIPELKQIVVVDVQKGEIVKYLPATDDRTLVVAGASRALIFSLTQGVVSRYRLDTFDRELTTTIPFDNMVDRAAMGCGSEGPVFLRTSVGFGALDSTRFELLDLETLKPIEADWPNGRKPNGSYRDTNAIAVSTDGKTISVSGLGTYRVMGNSMQAVGRAQFGNQAAAKPSADGRFFISKGRLFNANMQPLGDTATSFGNAVLSLTENYFISMGNQASHRSQRQDNQANAKLYLFGDSRPLVTIADLLPADAPTTQVAFVPDAGVIILVPPTNQKITLRKFDVDQALEQSGVDYLVVDSLPPTHASPGQLFEYDLSIKSKQGGVKCSLESSPDGMTLTPLGSVRWRVPVQPELDLVSVVINVEDASGQSVFHTLTLKLEDPDAAFGQLLAQVEIKKKEMAAKKEAADKLRRDNMLRRAPDAMRTNQLAKAREMKEAKESESSTNAASDSTHPVNQEFPFQSRIWTDSTGTHRVTATFMAIENKETVLLKLSDDTVRKIPLNRLRPADIYQAVESDLLRKQNGKPKESPDLESPFQKP